ncbi:MAG: hypothetical protein ACFFEV_01065 [Candidatus Thorarchaeota archaeon]
MQDIGYTMNLVELAPAIVILVILVIVIGYQKHMSGIRYWALALVKVLMIFLIWSILSFTLFIIIITYTGYYLEDKLFFINMGRMVLFGLLCTLLIIVELRSEYFKERSTNISLNTSE